MRFYPLTIGLATYLFAWFLFMGFDIVGLLYARNLYFSVFLASMILGFIFSKDLGKYGLQRASIYVGLGYLFFGVLNFLLPRPQSLTPGPNYMIFADIGWHIIYSIGFAAMAWIGYTAGTRLNQNIFK